MSAEVRGGRLEFGHLNISLEHATSFWAEPFSGTQNPARIHVHFNHRGCETNIALNLRTREAYQNTIRELLENTSLTPTLFFVDQIKIAPPAQIHLHFYQNGGAENFRFAGGRLFDGFHLSGTDQVVVLTSPVEMQAAKIQKLFQDIVAKLGNGNIPEALGALGDDRFSVVRRPTLASVGDSLDSVREYEVSEEGLLEVIRSLTTIVVPADVEELNQWLKDPKILEERRLAKFFDHLITLILRDPAHRTKIETLIPSHLRQKCKGAFADHLRRAFSRDPQKFASLSQAGKQAGILD